MDEDDHATQLHERSARLQAAGVSFSALSPPAYPFLCEGNVRLGYAELGPWNAIGKYSYINSGFIRRAVEIGRFCSLGRNVTIGTGTHDIGALSTSPYLHPQSNIVRYADPLRRKTVVIGHDVWIGDHAIIMTGVTVGTGAVIAAGSIVTKDVGPYAIVAGNYARPIGRECRFAPDVCARLLASKWWELPLDVLRSSPYGSPTEFLDWLGNREEGERREPFMSKQKRI